MCCSGKCKLAAKIICFFVTILVFCIVAWVFEVYLLYNLKSAIGTSLLSRADIPEAVSTIFAPPPISWQRICILISLAQRWFQYGFVVVFLILSFLRNNHHGNSTLVPPPNCCDKWLEIHKKGLRVLYIITAITAFLLIPLMFLMTPKASAPERIFFTDKQALHNLDTSFLMCQKVLNEGHYTGPYTLFPNGELKSPITNCNSMKFSPNDIDISQISENMKVILLMCPKNGDLSFQLHFHEERSQSF
jgi:hypothetical protein